MCFKKLEEFANIVSKVDRNRDVVCRQKSRGGHVHEITPRIHVASTKVRYRERVRQSRLLWGRKCANLGQSERILNYKCEILALLFAYPTGPTILLLNDTSTWYLSYRRAILIDCASISTYRHTVINNEILTSIAPSNLFGRNIFERVAIREM